jgi:PAB1-binding protein PBP1
MKIKLSGNQSPPENTPLSAVQASLCNVRTAQEQTVKLLAEMLKISRDTLEVLKAMKTSMDNANEQYEKAMAKSDEVTKAIRAVTKEVESDRLERVDARKARIIPVEQV